MSRPLSASTPRKFHIFVVIAALILVVGALGSASAQTLAGGNAHSVVLKSDGTVWTFGYNIQGQLGDSSTTPRHTPGQVTALTNIVAVAAGAHHSLALGDDGTVWAWGRNDVGQLGDGSTTQLTSPVSVGLTSVVAIAAGEHHSVALRSNGDVYTWGANDVGQLGTGSTTFSTNPVLILSALGTRIGAGFNHTLVVKADGTVWTAGANGWGQLGDGTTTGRTTLVQMANITGAVAVAAGAVHSVVLLANGTVKTTGANGRGALGDGGVTQFRTTPGDVVGLTDVTTIAAGAHHTLARTLGGAVWAWGDNWESQLGDGTSERRYVPVQVPGLTSIVSIGVGDSHSLAVDVNGVVFAWGRNANGQLGDGTTVTRSTPVAISGPGYEWKTSTPMFSLSSGTYSSSQTVVVTVSTPGATIHYTLSGAEPTESDPSLPSGGSVAINESQTLKAKAWKTGLPESSTAVAVYTLQVATPTIAPHGGSALAAAVNVTLVTTTPGAMLRYTLDGTPPTEASAFYTAPIRVTSFANLRVVGFRAGWSPSPTQAATFSFNYGMLAAPLVTPASGPYTSSVLVTLSAEVGTTIRFSTDGTAPTAASPVYSGSLLVESSSTVKARAFHPDYTTSPETSAAYEVVVAAPVLNPTAGAYAPGQLIAITSDTPGATIRYTLNGADPTTADPMVPSGGAIVAGNYTLKAKAWKTGATPSAVVSATYSLTEDDTDFLVSGGLSHSLALRGDGTLWAWGDNAGGQLGDGTTTNRSLPVLAAGLTGVAAIDAGSFHSLALRNDGSVLSFGANGTGALGDGTTTLRPIPVALTLLAPAVRVAAGEEFSAVLLANGSVMTTGRNNFGQLGDGTNLQRLSPVPVPGLTGVTAVTTGDGFCVAAKADGSIWSWGQNDGAQLGDGSRVHRNSPVLVTQVVSAVRGIAAGYGHALVVLDDGTVKAWGWNADGALGDGSTVDRLTPVTLGISDVVAVAAGYRHSLFLRSDGTVWASGGNHLGEIGDGTTTPRWTPVPVVGLSDIVAVSAGHRHSLAVAADGTVWTWGQNTNRQLGNGTTTNSLVPIAISGPNMNWGVDTPLVSLLSGTYSTAQVVTVTISDPTATLRYATTGLDPTESDPVVASGGALPIVVSQTLKVRAWKPGAPPSVVVTRNYELKVIAPEMTPGTATYASPQTVSIVSSTPGVSITYTTDGGEPTPTSPPFTSPLVVDRSLTVKARAYKLGWTPSDSSIASYWLAEGQLDSPTLSPPTGAYASPTVVTIAPGAAGTTVRYTLDGTAPTWSSPVYREPLLIAATTTVSAQAFKSGWTSSPMVSATYQLDLAGAAPTPQILPAGGRFTTKQTVTVTGGVSSIIRYTTSGLEPTESDAVVASGSTITIDRTSVLRVRAWQSGLAPSAVRSAAYLITGDIKAGMSHTLALAGDGKVFTWGFNQYGQVGDGQSVNRLTPFEALSDAIAIAAGDCHSLALMANGTVMAWGDNADGQIGDGGAQWMWQTPTAVNGLTQVIAIAAGGRHSLAVRADGTVWAWGRNTSGQLGDGTTTSRNVPVQVLGISGAADVTAGANFSMAVVRNAAESGSLWAWGANASGQLGDGTTIGRSVPMKVEAAASTSRVSTGAEWTMVRGAMGDVRTWGKNEYGQLANGTLVNGLTPSSALPLPATSAIVAGAHHGLSLEVSGTPWAWGRADNWQLGAAIGTCPGTGCLRPARVGGVGPSLAAAAGQLHTVLLGADGRVFTFGFNFSGQLGVGDTESRNAPTPVPQLQLANQEAVADPDDDGLSTWRELTSGSDPFDPDSNDDGLGDGDQALRGSPTHPDPDGDGVASVVERARGTDPFLADTDRDGVADGLDAFPLDPTRSNAPSPTPGDTTPPVIIITAPASVRPHPPD